MDQAQQQRVKPEQLVHRLKPWWGLAIAGLLGIGMIGALVAIHDAGQVTPTKMSVNSQKADDSWIDREPNRGAYTEAPAATPSPSPAMQATATPLPQYQPLAQNYIPPAAPNPAVEQHREEYQKALGSDLLINPRGQSQVLETPRLVSAAGEAITGQDGDGIRSSGPIAANPLPTSPYTITTGTVIYSTLETGINSDIPGDVLGRVAQDVKDSVSERYVLIPHGSKLIGSYSNQLIPSQERLMVKWRMIVFPNGGELDLPDLTGSDAAGYAGFQDQVNHHYAKVWTPALLMSAISAGMMMADYPTITSGASGTGAYSMNPSQMAAMGAAQQLGGQATSHMANVQIAPTIQIRPGYHFRVLVTRDLVFSGPYEDTTDSMVNTR